MHYDLTQIKNPQTKSFLEQFFKHRRINMDFYERVPEAEFDFRMINTPSRKSDSPRESLIHQIYVTRKYIYGITTSTLKFDGVTPKKLKNPQKMTKQELLTELDNTGQELVDLLKQSDFDSKTVNVPWDKKPISAISCLEGLSNHEILHTGWNLPIMDHLDMKRFDSLCDMYGN